MQPWYQVIYFDTLLQLSAENALMEMVTKERWMLLNDVVISEFERDGTKYKIVGRRSFVTKSELFANTYFLILDIKKVL